MAVQFVQKDQGGTIYYDAPERWDASPAPTVTLYAPDGGEMVSEQSATEGPTTTVSGAAAAGGTTIPVTSTTDLVVGREYLVGPNSSGQSEWVTVSAIGSGQVTTRDELQYTYAANDVFCSTRLEVTLSSSDAGTAYRSCLARWKYYVDSQARIDTSIFHISIWMPTLNVTEQDILRREPRAIDLLGSRQRLSELIQEIWEHEILEDLGMSIDPGALTSGEALRMATIYRVLGEMYLAAQDHEHSDRLMDLYRAAWERVLQQAPVDLDQSGTITDSDILRPAWSGRLYRG